MNKIQVVASDRSLVSITLIRVYEKKNGNNLIVSKKK